MNSYNKYPQNLLALYALENQTFDVSQMEIILVDDASTDATPALAQYHPACKLQYIRLEENTGRSKAKNIGIHASQGDVLIILDAEMLVDSGFVERHYNYHQAEDKLIVTGCTNHYGVYTVLDYEMEKQELKQFAHLAKQHATKLPRKTRTILKKSLLRNPFFQHKRKDKISIFSKQDIWDLKYKALSFFNGDWSSEIFSAFGQNLNGFFAPWMFVITRNISVRRSVFDAVGGFYEELQGWGYEDWEFGYRVIKYGGKILEDSQIPIYHQEHYKMTTNFFKEATSNYLKFYNRHPEFEIGVVSLSFIQSVYLYNLFRVNQLVREFRMLEKECRERTMNFRFCYLQFFRTILQLSSEGQDIKQLSQASGIEAEQLQIVLSEKEYITSIGIYQNLVETFEFLLSM